MPRGLVEQLATLEFVDRGDNVVLVGTYQTGNQIMRAAIDDGLLFKNVAENIEKDPAPKKKKRALTELERIHLEDLELDPQASTLLHMLLYTGMRRQ